MNSQHLEILKEGVETWNEWRCKNPQINPDLTDASLPNRNLSNANLSNADLTNIDFHKAILMDVSFVSSNLERANLNCSNLFNANFENSSLFNADIRGADLFSANLERTDLAFIKYNRKASYQGIRLGGCYGNERFRQFASHQAFIEEMERSSNSNRIFCSVWRILADCGRTPWAWILWSGIFVIYYATIYSSLGAEAFNPDMALPFNFWTMLYYSIVTFTTLGFGDITPICGVAAFYVTFEVITGYVMLGGLISFLFSKLLPKG